MHPLLPGAAVPGAPVAAWLGVQKSDVIPHWPKMSQHALMGHGFNAAHEAEEAGYTVLLTCGPHTAFLHSLESA
jgi:hypothetical protein